MQALASDSGQVKLIYLLFSHLKRLEGYYLSASYPAIYMYPSNQILDSLT
jgi:hypothetical protein